MGNKENMRQAMKELLGLVGIGSGEKGQEASGPGAEQRVNAEGAPQTDRAPRRPQPPQERPGSEHTPATDVEQTREIRPEKESSEEQPVRLDEQQQEVAYTVQRQFFGAGKEKEGQEWSLGGFGRRKEEPVEPVEDTFEAVGASAPGDLPNAQPFVTRATTTIISAGTTLFGDIRSEGEVELQGKLKGNVEACGNVRITGKVLGDVKGDAVDLIGCAVQGNITATGTVRIDAGTIVVGDIVAGSLITDGKMKGNVQVEKSATFQKNAVLAGNVSAGLVSILEGAKVQGTVRIAQDSDTTALFGEELDI